MDDWNDDLNLDAEAKEFEYQTFKETMDSQSKHFQRYQTEQAQIQAKQQEANIFNDALKDAGLSQEQFNQLVAMDPEATQADFKQGVKEYVSKIARRRDKKGRFLPGKPQAQGQPSGPAPQRPEGKRYDGKGMNTNQDVHNAVLDIIADDPMFDM